MPVAEHLGAVRAWWRDQDFANAEAAAFEALMQQAATPIWPERWSQRTPVAVSIVCE